MIDIFYCVIIIYFVAFIAVILFFIGVLSFRKSKDIRLLSVTIAFGIFFIKNLILAFCLYFNIIQHGDLELFDSCCDLLALIFLFLPLLKKRTLTYS